MTAKPPIPRVADLSTPLAIAIPAAGFDLAALDYGNERLTVKEGPNVRFTGAEIASNGGNPERLRYEQCVLFAVKGGGFVAARAWHSNAPGEESFWSAETVETVEQTMAAWGWSTAGKGMAKKLKWDVTRYIGERDS